MAALSLEVFTVGLDGALSNLVCGAPLYACFALCPRQLFYSLDPLQLRRWPHCHHLRGVKKILSSSQWGSPCPFTVLGIPPWLWEVPAVS